MNGNNNTPQLMYETSRSLLFEQPNVGKSMAEPALLRIAKLDRQEKSACECRRGASAVSLSHQTVCPWISDTASLQWLQSQMDRIKPIDSTLDDIARYDRADAGRRSGQYQVAGAQVIKAGQVGDDLVELPDQFREITILPYLAID